MLRFLVINGPNMDVLGRRERGIYGSATLEDLEALCVRWGETNGVYVECLQSNHEGDLIEMVHRGSEEFQGVVMNAAGYGHTSVALRDAVSACSVPVVEVHMTNVASRETFRHRSLLTPVVRGLVMGLGIKGYVLALQALKDMAEGGV
ncbi:3-dehydroquinate dehydratase, type II [Thermanaerovibrio velox DSM 12556]|uniref:3-dehydroquinate dehydratase n=1 Tax=Thermanaerovibrio velox DSM 12556 TaxID=926567 RepID=H0UNF6_9BACT|nr:type II 3-dehydroquinate dehydratase [Thermanaerovibrio velox]EHM09363.1 3-dehydroquinate dehydratase, type II [Thermanaerovibrio velox DSM 12556]